MGCPDSKPKGTEAGAPGLKIKDDNLPAAAASGSNRNLKILILGDASVGKTSLLLRLVDKKFNTIPVLGSEDSRKVTIQVGGRSVNLEIWDTAGQERFRTITSSFYRGSQGVMLAFDLSSAKTFTGLERWCQEVDLYGTPQITKILVGTKSDLPRTTSFDDADDFAAGRNMEYIETSAKEDFQVEKAFELLVQKILDI